MPWAEAYCVKRKAKKEMANAQEVTMKNGRPAMQGFVLIVGQSSSVSWVARSRLVPYPTPGLIGFGEKVFQSLAG